MELSPLGNQGNIHFYVGSWGQGHYVACVCLLVCLQTVTVLFLSYFTIPAIWLLYIVKGEEKWPCRSKGSQRITSTPMCVFHVTLPLTFDLYMVQWSYLVGTVLQSSTYRWYQCLLPYDLGPCDPRWPPSKGSWWFTNIITVITCEFWNQLLFFFLNVYEYSHCFSTFIKYCYALIFSCYYMHKFVANVFFFYLDTCSQRSSPILTLYLPKA